MVLDFTGGSIANSEFSLAKTESWISSTCFHTGSSKEKSKALIVSNMDSYSFHVVAQGSMTVSLSILTADMLRACRRRSVCKFNGVVLEKAAAGLGIVVTNL